ncbi:MAG: hypothetical protein Q8P86_01515 [bacterium]|nr:hypothetical protein [bacterium]
MKIVIATGIYPPQIGGPAQYAKNLALAFESLGHAVSVVHYKFENLLPTGLRHVFFFLRVFGRMLKADFVVSLDSFSVGFPTAVATGILGKKHVMRTGGDFLWESYVERTGDTVLLKNFYDTRLAKLSFKEKVIFSLTKWTLKKADKVVFSTDWQRSIWARPYEMNWQNTAIIENYYGPKEKSEKPTVKTFLGATRKLKWKNHARLKSAFAMAKVKERDIELDLENEPYDKFIQKMKKCYAVVLLSLGDISPNMILDSVRFSKPFILTRENGLYDRLKDVGMFADPEDENDIAEKIKDLCQPEVYEEYRRRVEGFTFVHTYEDIAKEFLSLS